MSLCTDLREKFWVIAAITFFITFLYMEFFVFQVQLELSGQQDKYNLLATIGHLVVSLGVAFLISFATYWFGLKLEKVIVSIANDVYDEREYKKKVKK